jgi:phosphatidylglycerophosphatase A
VVPNGIAIETTPQHSEGTRRFRLFLATAGGVGLLPQAPGTFGAALAIPILAYAPLLAAGVPSGFSALPWIWPSLVTGFVAFRVFDIAKPGPVGWADRELGGGWGVMVDDVVAGALAALVLAALMLALDGPGLRIAAVLSGAGQPS